ncbi:MAG: NAD(P)-binding domain-containing protein [Acidobacteriota bacterium]
MTGPKSVLPALLAAEQGRRQEVKIGLIGGTGAEGKGIGLRLAAAGFEVGLGSRRRDRARETAEELNRQIGSTAIRGMENGRLIETCQLLFLTVPFVHAGPLLEEHHHRFKSEHTLVDVTVPVGFEKGPRLLGLEEDSGSEHLLKRLPPGVPLVGAFKTLPAHLLCDLGSRLDCDEWVCSDSAKARRRVMEVVRRIPDLRWLDGGALRYCRCLEAMTVMAIAANRRYRVQNCRFRLTGL